MKFTEKFRLPLYEAADRVLKEQFNETNQKVETALKGKADSGHTHTAAGVGAAPASHSHTAAQVGAVPAGRKVNGKPLSSDITLTAADVGAAAAGHTHTLASLGLDSLGQAVVGAVAGLKIATGRVSTGNNEACGVGYAEAGFTSPPAVICTYCFSSTNDLTGSPIGVTNCSTTGCTIHARSYVTIAYIAIGV